MNGVAKRPKRIVSHQRKTGGGTRPRSDRGQREDVRIYDNHCIKASTKSSPSQEREKKTTPSI
jgi:hypothetical protein